MKTIGIFCAANSVDQKYIDDAQKLAKLMVQHGYDLVWGGSDKGLMKVMADAVQQEGGKIIGISMELVRDQCRKVADEMIVTKDLSARKALILKRSDAIMLLVGGIGSLDEVTEILELKKHNQHTKPVVILNTDNYYEGLEKLFNRMKQDGFLTILPDELLYFAKTPDEAMEYINKSLGVGKK